MSFLDWSDDVWLTDERRLALQPGPLSEILTIANLYTQRAGFEFRPEFRLCWMKLCSSDNTTQRRHEYDTQNIQQIERQNFLARISLLS